MRLLLDTHALVWGLLKIDRLSSTAKNAIAAQESTIHVSVASAWEIAIKAGLGKWPEAHAVLDSFEVHLRRAGYELLPIAVAHVRHAGLMVSDHRDPFDRLLAAQALAEGLTIITVDARLRSLGATCLW